jgi:hypothetical protein
VSWAADKVNMSDLVLLSGLVAVANPFTTQSFGHVSGFSLKSISQILLPQGLEMVDENVVGDAEGGFVTGL